MTQKEIEAETRKVFHELHKAQGEDKFIFNRLADLLGPKYLQVADDWFKDKVCLDAGCGSNANATFSMLRHGAKRVHCFDLDKTIFETVPGHLKEFEGRYEVSEGNVLKMDFPDNSFDFVHCAGVLAATVDVKKGMSELARVTKPGGTMYVLLYGKGGLVREIVTFLRNKYAADAEFRDFVVNLNADFFSTAFKWILPAMAKHSDEWGTKVSAEFLESLFDKDMILTIKDRIMSPLYHETSQEEAVEWFEQNGFSQVQRLTRYPRYKNIRRFLSPIYNDYSQEVSRVLYGSGEVQIKAIKN